MKAREQFETERLSLRRPLPSDAEAIFSRYASVPEVTRFLGWPRHTSIEQTKAFLVFSDAEWERWPAGPYLIESRTERRLIGSSGFSFETPTVAMTGYVLARDAWGNGYATEALRAIVTRARELGVCRLYALCHAEHSASTHVLDKCGFTREGLRKGYFPNLGIVGPEDCLCYAQMLE